MIATLRYFFPQKKHRLIAGTLVIFSITYLMILSLQGAGIFETYYLAAKNLSQGLDPYAQYPGFNYFKYSPFFLLIPMSILFLFPLKIAALLWQAGSILLYLTSLIHFFGGIKKKSFNPSVAFAFFFSLMASFDLNSNGVYLQSNTLIVSGMVFSMSFYQRGKYFWAALILAYVTNIKIFPLVLALLLSLEGNKKFIYLSIVFNFLFLLLPILFYSWETNSMLYAGWWKVLTLDKNMSFGSEEIHHYLGLRPLLKVIFNIEFNKYYFHFGAMIGGLIALPYFFKKKFSKSDIRQLLVLSLTYILVFNTRTEGPSLVLMGPLYAILFWGLYTNDIWKGYKKHLAWSLLMGGFFLVSISCTDLIKNTSFQNLVWENNLRGVGIIFFFLTAFFSLFWGNLKKQLFD